MCRCSNVSAAFVVSHRVGFFSFGEGWMGGGNLICPLCSRVSPSNHNWSAWTCDSDITGVSPYWSVLADRTWECLDQTRTSTADLAQSQTLSAHSCPCCQVYPLPASFNLCLPLTHPWAGCTCSIGPPNDCHISGNFTLCNICNSACWQNVHSTSIGSH